MKKFIGFRALLHLLPSGFSLLFLTTDAKNLEVCIFKEDERACIRRLPSNWETSLIFFVMYFFLSCKVHSLWSEFCRTTSFCMELVLPLCPNQVPLWENAMLYTLWKFLSMQCFVPIKTNFVKNSKPHYSYLGKFCRDRCNYINLEYYTDRVRICINQSCYHLV